MSPKCALNHGRDCARVGTAHAPCLGTMTKTPLGYWTISIITDTGRKVPHWTEDTRRGAMRRLSTFKLAYPGVRFALTLEVLP